MTIKVSEIVIDALEDIIVQAEEAPIEQAEARAAIRVLNDMMYAWAATGIEIGYSEVSDMGDPVTIPLGAVRGVKANLAIDLATKYDVVPSEAVRVKAKEGYRACVALSINMAGSDFPSTLPQGSGNTYPGYTDNTFYPGQEDTILSETGGSIALEDDTEAA